MKINAIFSYKNTIYYFFVHVPSLCNISSYCLKTQNANLKARVTRNQSPQHFPKINISYLLILTRKCAYRGLELLIFGNFCVLCLLVAIVSRFVLWPYYQRIALITARKVSKYGVFLVRIQKNKDLKKIRIWIFFTQYLVLLFCNTFLTT